MDTPLADVSGPTTEPPTAVAIAVEVKRIPKHYRAGDRDRKAGTCNDKFESVTDSHSAPSSLPQERIRLVVLFGGRSAEHDVSCVSAREMIAATDTDRFDIHPIAVGRDGTWRVASDVKALIDGGAELPASLPTTGDSVAPQSVLQPAGTGAALDPMPAGSSRTVVFPLLHGPMGEDGTVQGLLELADVPYVGTGVLGSALCMDKIAAKEMATAHNIPQANYAAVRAAAADDAWFADVASDLGFPMFVKPANLGSSVGISRATDPASLRAAVELAGSYDEWVIVEEEIVGREIELAVLGTTEMHVSLPGEILPGDDFYSYADKYENGVAKTEVPANLSERMVAEVQSLALRSARALRVEGLARVDFFLSSRRGFLLNEINTMPGFTPISMYPQLWAASGLPYSDLIESLVALAMERHDRRRRHQSTSR